jgi:hypothetical protein
VCDSLHADERAQLASQSSFAQLQAAVASATVMHAREWPRNFAAPQCDVRRIRPLWLAHVASIARLARRSGTPHSKATFAHGQRPLEEKAMQKRATRLCMSVLCGLSGAVLSISAIAGGEGADSSKYPMKMMDADKDGRVTAAEHAAGAERMFGKIDADGDGRVTTVEMDAHHQKMMGKNEARPGKHKMMSSDEKIRTIDKDGDGAITAEEHAAGSQKMFGKMDADKDGALTAEEIKSGHRKLMSAHDQE